ncbi:MSCRAMM family adhesin SdrC [Natrinema caseinilyticum]|uniref:MSCRAMM family adhesin SdrC n=1 Tax=Natrinema caseinilyticum TaxID=2961570 RepID=UPI0020C4A422|nr:MSCRAMM family adhesin SdrC [Natrinema caseinilyticum]
MRIRTPDPDRANSASRTGRTRGRDPTAKSAATADSSFGSRLARVLLVAGVVIGLGYLVRRLRGSREDGSEPVDEFRDRAADAVPDELSEPAVSIPIGGRADDERDAGDEAVADRTDAEGREETANAEYTDERSDEEIAERAESNVRTEPAEPGEMAVAEDVAEELLESDGSTGTEGEADTETGADADTETGADADTETGADADTETGADADTETGADADADTTSDAITDDDTDTEADIEREGDGGE